jgi:hypothetical protein
MAGIKCPIIGRLNCTPAEQCAHILFIDGALSKLTALFCGCAVQASGRQSQPKSPDFSIVQPPTHPIDLESAAFLFHINGTTQGITGSLRAACSEPVLRFLACPFS